MKKIITKYGYIFQLSNIINLIGITVAGIFGYFGIRDNNNQDILNAILAILEALAIAQILANNESFKVRKIIEKLFQSSSSFLSTRKDIDAHEPFQQFLEQGHDIVIMGVSLLGTIGPLRDFLKSLANQGIHLRFLLLNPDSQWLVPAAESHGVSAESLRNDIMASLAHLKQLSDSVDRNKAEFVQFRLLNTIPYSSIVMRDGNTEKGIIRCELYLYQADTSKRPAFILTPNDGKCFNQYRDIIDRLWIDSQSQKKPEEQNQSARSS